MECGWETYCLPCFFEGLVPGLVTVIREFDDAVTPRCLFAFLALDRIVREMAVLMVWVKWLSAISVGAHGLSV